MSKEAIYIGKVMVLKTFVLSRLWYATTIIPLSALTMTAAPRRGNIYSDQLVTINGEPSKAQNHLQKIVDLVHGFIWGSLTRTKLSKEALRLPYDRGGLNMVDIGTQANALLASQIPQIINSASDQPSSIYARFWFARNWDFYGNLRDKRFPELAFLNDCNHGTLLGKTWFKMHLGTT